MKPNRTPDEQPEKLEAFVREQLGNLKPARRPDLWQRIAAEQQKANPGLRLRHLVRTYALPAAAAVALVAVALWWNTASQGNTQPTASSQAGSTATTLAPLPQTPTILPSETTPTFVSKAFDVQAATNRVPGNTVRFKVAKGIAYVNPATGNTVTIPPAALVRPDGTPATGEATLFVREYRSLADYLAAAVPMHYGDARGGFYFNSGGMFEVRVQQNGEELRMAPGETYSVGFTPTNAGLEETRLYYFDETKGRWLFQPDPAMGQGEEATGLPPVLSEQDVARNNRSLPRACTPWTPELKRGDVPSQLVMQAVATGQKLASGAMPLPAWFVKNPNMSEQNALSLLERTDIRIVAHRDNDDQFFPQDMNGVFTELRAFKGYFFQADVNDRNNAKAAELLRNGQSWRRINIVPEGDNRCMMVLYDDESFIQFYANLYPSPGLQNFKPEAIFAEYQRLRAERQDNFSAKYRALNTFADFAPMFQTEAEWCIGFESWVQYFADNREIMVARYDSLVAAGLSTDENAARTAWEAWRRRLRNMRSAQVLQEGGPTNAQYLLNLNLNLSSFGLYNCDQIFRLAGNAPLIVAGYTADNGDRIAPKTISMVDRAAKIMLSFNPQDRLPAMEGREIDVVVITRSGKVYLLPAETYAKLDLKNRRSHVFNMRDVTDVASTPEGWNQLLNL